MQHELERDQAVRLDLPGLVYHAHAAAAELAQDFIAGNGERSRRPGSAVARIGNTKLLGARRGQRGRLRTMTIGWNVIGRDSMRRAGRFVESAGLGEILGTLGPRARVGGDFGG